MEGWSPQNVNVELTSLKLFPIRVEDPSFSKMTWLVPLS